MAYSFRGVLAVSSGLSLGCECKGVHFSRDCV